MKLGRCSHACSRWSSWFLEQSFCGWWTIWDVSTCCIFFVKADVELCHVRLRCCFSLLYFNWSTQTVFTLIKSTSIPVSFKSMVTPLLSMRSSTSGFVPISTTFNVPTTVLLQQRYNGWKTALYMSIVSPSVFSQVFIMKSSLFSKNLWMLVTCIYKMRVLHFM